jgi:hypothetical protein
MEAVYSSETSANFYRGTRRDIPVDRTLHDLAFFILHIVKMLP